MWGLDRLSSHSTFPGTPPSRSESYSPAPRRGYPAPGLGSLPMRPDLNPRSTSLSLISPTDSSTSLPATARLPHGGPRRRPTGGGLSNVPDPVQVLVSIMGGRPRKPITSNGDGAGALQQKPEEVVVDIDFGELSLHDFAAQQAPKQRQTSFVNTCSAQSVEECTLSHLALGLFAHVCLQIASRETNSRICTSQY